MIKLIHVSLAGHSKLALTFSDGSEGVYDFTALLSRDTVLTIPLRQAQAFARFFLELGALCWPNGLEFNAMSLHAEMTQAGLLRQVAHAA